MIFKLTLIVNFSGANKSVWLSEVPENFQYASLQQHIDEGTFDVVVIGAGITVKHSIVNSILYQTFVYL